MSVQKQNQIKDMRRKQIVSTAVELFDRHGYANTTIARITKEAGMSKGLVYHYFKSKEEILYAINENVTDCIAECAAVEDAVEAIRLFTNRLLSFPYIDGYVPPIRVLFTAVIRGDVSADVIQSIDMETFGSSYFGNLFLRGQEQGHFKEGDARQFGAFYWNCLVGRMALMNPNKDGTEYRPDVDEMLLLFKK